MLFSLKVSGNLFSDIQNVRMKGIQNNNNNKIYIYIYIYISETNCHTRIRFRSSERKTLKVFHAWFKRMQTSLWTCYKELKRHRLSSAKCASRTRQRSISMEL
jgi:hypothetical protein